jgi:uncharacterized protein YegP (UPF0339 family)
MAAKFEVMQDDEGRYYFALKAANGEVVADSQAYRSISDLREGMLAVQTAAAEAQVPKDDADIRNVIVMHYIRRPAE